MTDMSAFEHQVETVLQGAAGPSRPVDAAAVVRRLATETASSPAPFHTRRLQLRTPFARTEGGFSMFSALKFAAAAAILALVGGVLLSGLVGSPTDGPVTPAAVTAEPSPATNEDASLDGAPAFPTGTFNSLKNSAWYHEFREDGTGRVFIHPHNVEVEFPYTVEGDVVAYPPIDDDEEEGMTERWAYDGEVLSLVPLGEVSPSHPYTIAGPDWKLVPDPVEVVVAAEEIEAGGTVYSTWAVTSIEPAAEAGDAYTEVTEVMGRIAVVPIAQGQPISPDMLEPPAE